MTSTGNLTRAVVAEMIDLFDWPDFDKTEMFRLNKVINEPDFPPLHFVRLVAEAARLVRRYRGVLKPTVQGRDLSKEPQSRALLAVLFHVATSATSVEACMERGHSATSASSCGHSPLPRGTGSLGRD